MLCVGGITVAICFTLINMEILKRKQEVLEQKHFQVRQKGIVLHCSYHQRWAAQVTTVAPQALAQQL